MSGAVQAAIVHCAFPIRAVLRSNEATLRNLRRIMHSLCEAPANDVLISADAGAWKGAAKNDNNLKCSASLGL